MSGTTYSISKDQTCFKPAARHFNLPGYSPEHMEICESTYA